MWKWWYIFQYLLFDIEHVLLLVFVYIYSCLNALLLLLFCNIAKAVTAKFLAIKELMHGNQNSIFFVMNSVEFLIVYVGKRNLVS